jgi:beta-glucosidase
MTASGLAALALPASAAPDDTPAYKNTALPFNVRAADLVSRMTLEEKYDQLIAMQPHATWRAKPKAIERLGVRPYGYWGEANHGLYFPTIGDATGGTFTDQTQYPQSTSIASTWNSAITQDIAAGIADEARITYNTSCPPGEANPTPTGGACNGLTYWSPNQNLNRDPRWGRADESYTEDPLLAGEVASAFVTGMQGNTSSRPDTIPSGPNDYIQAVATPKHYLANNSEANRNYGTSNLTERSMHEYFLPPFAASAGDAGARSLMTAYNAVSVVEDYTTDYPSAASYPTQWSPRDNATVGGTPGTPAASSRYTIETLLRRSYGFDGFIVSDCDAITRVWQTGTRGHSWQPAQVGAQIGQALGDAWALKAGTDLDCSGGDYPAANGLPAAQNQGFATEADVDIALVRAFTARFQMGEFDPVAAVPWNNESYSLSAAGDPAVKMASAAHRAVAHESALEAPVLLKNAGDTLPFGAARTGKTVALGHVDTLNRFQSGSYSGPTVVNTTFAQALAAQTGLASTSITAGSETPFLSSNLAVFPNALNTAGNAIQTSMCSANPCDPAVDADTAEYRISQADNIVVVVGHRNNDGGEGTDRATVVLPRMQAELIRDSVAPLAQKYGKKVVVWIQAKTMVDLSLFKNLPEVGAIVWSSFNGMYQGSAMAELLFNDTVTLEDGRTAIANFSGKLPLTWYSDVNAQLGPSAAPDYGIEDYRMTKAEGSKCGRTYLYYQVGAGCDAPDYVFGHGLSYSPFVYGAPTLSSSTITPDQSVTVSVPVSNQVANYLGKAVVEVYAKAPTGADGNQRPLKQLKGFAKSGLITGTPETVQITINAGDLWFWDDVNHKKVFPTGDWTILAGPSSADADLKPVTLKVTGERTAGVEVVSAQPDGTELSLDTPDNRINAQLSVTKHDMTFWDLADSALRVEYTSSNPSVATVNAAGTVAPVSTGTALITATATANGESKSFTFPVVVTSGAPDATGSVFVNPHTSLVNFGDIRVSVDDAPAGVQLSADLVPAAASVTYGYQIAPMDTNTAGASVTADGVLTATKAGRVRVTVTADSSGVKTSESALITIAPPVDKSTLQDVVDLASGLSADSFTTSSWANADLAAVLPGVLDVLADVDATQAEVDAATTMVNDAMALLVPRGDARVLEALITVADGITGKLSGFTDATANALETALASAKTVYQARNDKAQAPLDEAVALLQTALSNLVVKSPVVDKAVLQHVISGASALSNADGAYTAASWSKLQAEIADANRVLADASSTQAQADQAVKELSSAMAGLVPVRGKSSALVVSRVKLNQSQLSLVKGKSLTLNEAVYYSNSHSAWAAKVVWKSSNTKVATVDQNGKVTAKKTGSATITVTAKDMDKAGKKLSTSVKVSVVKKKVKVKSVSASVPKSLKKGQTVYITGKYSSSKATGAKVTYKSSKPSVVEADSVGRLMAKGKGTAKVTVKAGGKSKTYTVKVS